MKPKKRQHILGFSYVVNHKEQNWPYVLYMPNNSTPSYIFFDMFNRPTKDEDIKYLPLLWQTFSKDFYTMGEE
jgi:hypothetical protein